MTEIHLVRVHGRADGIYAFTAPEHAERFAQAVVDTGGECDEDELPLCGASMTDELVAGELARG